jgi:hypothetical protein
VRRKWRGAKRRSEKVALTGFRAAGGPSPVPCAQRQRRATTSSDEYLNAQQPSSDEYLNAQQQPSHATVAFARRRCSSSP